MYKKIGYVYFIASIILTFNCHAMEDDYALVAVVDNVSSLVGALQKLDDAYETKEQAFSCGACSSTEIKTTIRTYKQTYYNLVTEQKTDIVLDEQQDLNWQDINNLTLFDKGLKTALFVLPNYINPANIKYLDLSKNNLEELPLSLLAKTMPHLENLNVSNNTISYVSTHGSKLPRLTHLTLSHNKISALNVIQLLKKCPLTMLDLSYNPLEVVLTDTSESAWNAFVSKDLAIDVRNTKISLDDIALLKKYCLAGMHNTIKMEACTPFAAMSTLFSYFSFVGMSWFAHALSLATFAGCVLVGTGAAGTIAYVIYKKDVAEHKKFHAIRYDDTNE